jgi:hypothetical protein
MKPARFLPLFGFLLGPLSLAISKAAQATPTASVAPRSGRLRWATLGLSLLTFVICEFVDGAPRLQRLHEPASTSHTGSSTAKNPKLSMQVADLARSIPQQTEYAPPGQNVPSPTEFSVEKLPKSLRDTIHAGRMKITKDGNVQLYIQIKEINQENLQQLEASELRYRSSASQNPIRPRDKYFQRFPRCRLFFRLP